MLHGLANIRTLAIGAIVLLALVGTHRAEAVQIDDFSQGFPGFPPFIPNNTLVNVAGAETVEQASLTSVMSGYRKLTVSGATPFGAQLVLNPTNDTVTLGLVSTTGEMSLEYGEFGGSLNPTGVSEDLTANSASEFKVRVVSKDLATPNSDLSITVRDTGGDSDTQTIQLPNPAISSPEVLTISFSDFASAVDFSSVEYVKFDFDINTSDTDLIIDFLSTGPVPVPAALPAGLAMLAALVLRRRRLTSLAA